MVIKIPVRRDGKTSSNIISYHRFAGENITAFEKNQSGKVAYYQAFTAAACQAQKYNKMSIFLEKTEPETEFIVNRG